MSVLLSRVDNVTLRDCTALAPLATALTVATDDCTGDLVKLEDAAIEPEGVCEMLYGVSLPLLEDVFVCVQISGRLVSKGS